MSPAPAAEKTLAGHVSAVVAGLTPKGRLPAGTQLDLAIGLPLRNDAALNTFLHEVYDPGSTNFHRFLTPEEFTARFGPTANRLSRSVKEFARTNGLAITHDARQPCAAGCDGKKFRTLNARLSCARCKPTGIRWRRAISLRRTPNRRLTRGPAFAGNQRPQRYAKPKPMLHERPAGVDVPDGAGSGATNEYFGSDFRYG